MRAKQLDNAVQLIENRISADVAVTFAISLFVHFDRQWREKGKKEQ